MAYILTDQLLTVEDATEAFRRYQRYLRNVASSFPPNAFQLATSEWYHDFNDHRCPHDARLESFSVGEIGVTRNQPRNIEITIRLLSAYQDGHIELRYSDVRSYQCEFKQLMGAEKAGHADWRYDEFRLSEPAVVVHEIEWWHMRQTARWLIEAGDVEFTWIPIESALGA